MDWTAAEGSPFPLGATWVAKDSAWNFALYSKNAAEVTLLLYAEADLVNPVFTYRFDYLRNKSARIWHCRVPQAALRGARYYAYSVGGPRPQGGREFHAFDPDKVLLDPYAKAVYFPPDFDRTAAARPGSNAGKAPLGLLDPGDPFDWGDDRRPRHQWDTIIYELHVRGFTRHPSSGVSPERRGTYAGLIEKIPYLKDLGVTVVELMPVFQCDPQEGSCWGYMPLNFFAPHRAYGSRPGQCDPRDEFRAMVRALHTAGIEVVLDVVYNHTAEGDRAGPVYSFKGIDNATYYLTTDRPERPYADFSGTGNTLRGTSPHVRRMIVDSAWYWVQEMHVDGLRFDLASALARNDDGSVNWDDPFDLAPHADPLDVRLIVEPWDAAGAYQLGRAFPARGCLQWNGRFRDEVRRFVRGDPGLVPALMQRLYGSDDLFPDDRPNAFHPYQSVNFVTCHDGFTLYDLVAYDRKHNEANGHGNADGMDDNHSWNCGWEGDDEVPAGVLALRRRQAKNFCCLLMLANGTPMFRAGDEFLHTQGGNNNPYNQDNETTWLDWDRLHTHPDVFRFFRSIIAFRKAHPSLGRSRFWREDVRWYGTGPVVDMGPDSRTLAYSLSGRSQGDADLYVMINASGSDRAFEIQEGPPDEWQLAFDTARASPADFPEPADRERVRSPSYVVCSHSIVGLIRSDASCRPN